jgi:predicted dehydrogenase
MGLTIALLGLGQFASGFSRLFARHPQVDRLVLCDLEADRVRRRFADLKRLAPGRVREADCHTDYQEVLRGDADAVVVITQQWLHAEQALQALEHGKSVWSAVPLTMIPDTQRILDLADRLVRTVQRTGRHYMLAETTYFRPEIMFCRRQAAAGAFGRFVHTEAGYLHAFDLPGCDLRKVMASRLSGAAGEAWRGQLAGLPPEQGMGPMLYGTHSLCGPLSVMRSRAQQVSCFGQQPMTDDPYFRDMGERFANQTALFRLANGATVRICEHRETAGEGEHLAITGTAGSFDAECRWRDARDRARHRQVGVAEMRDTLPEAVVRAYADAESEGVALGYANDFSSALAGHGGSHPFLVHEFVDSVASDRIPAILVWDAARYAAAGVMAHRSAQRDGECLAIPDWGHPREAAALRAASP